MDTKSQKGDSDFAAAANELPENIACLTISNKDEQQSIINPENDCDYQNCEKEDIINDRKESSSTNVSNEKENAKKKKKHKHTEKSKWRYVNAFQQKQQQHGKQNSNFTYSVSYFNWAVSDEEEDEEDEDRQGPNFSSTSYHYNHNRYNCKTMYNKGSNPNFRCQRRIKKLYNNEEELPIENEVSELSVISSSANDGIVLTEEFIEVTLPFKRLSISKNRSVR